jgi:hypothetical protein
MTRKLTIAAIASLLLALTLGPAVARADFGIATASTTLSGPEGEPLLQAGAHPDVTTNIQLNTRIDPEIEQPAVDGNPKDIDVTLPPGLIGNPKATPKCTQSDLLGGGVVANCPPESQVGVATITNFIFGPSETQVPVYNLNAPPGVAGQFGFNLLGVVVTVDAGLTDNGEYRLEADISRISQALSIGGTKLTLWGVPADPSHDLERTAEGQFGPMGEPVPSMAPKHPLMSNPTSCPGTPLRTEFRADSWQNPGAFDSTGSSEDEEGNPLVIEGCDEVPFEASFGAQPSSREAEAPTGLTVEITVPQNEFAEGRSASALRDATVTLPEGMAVNPASAGGLGSCSPGQIGLGDDSAPSCPDSAKIGAVEIETPLLEAPLHGSVYLAQQKQNKFGSLLALYLAVNDPKTGTILKLPGKVEPNPSTGQLVASFEDQPQVPFEHLRLQLFGGPRAALMTPPSCGAYATAAKLVPWSGTAAVEAHDSFQITTGPGGGPCPNGGFDPKLSAGTTNPLAGGYSPFVLRLSRSDGSQRFGAVEVTLPRGLLAKLAKVPYCPEDALAAIPAGEGTGAGQLALPGCPAASRVGRVAVSAGAGSDPFQVDTGSAYLAGPYKGAPLSLAVVVPALAGPFDLGNVVVRTALRVDPETAQVTAVSDALPTILQGIPLDLRQVRVDLDRSGFTLNPTSCATKSVEATVTSVAGATAIASDRFQAVGCRNLGFSPHLALRLKGGTARGAHPALTATLKAKRGEANIRRAQVQMPHSEFLAQEDIKTICTRVQFAAGNCPKGSIYGYAEAVTPLLDKPLRGPVYLRSSSHKLPDLVAALRGQISIDLDGRIDSHDQGMRVTFASVPDAPIAKFVLRMRGGSKGLLVNSRDLCARPARAVARFDGQNGKPHDAFPLLQAGCGKPLR